MSDEPESLSAVIDAARRCFARDGLKRTTMEDIAKEAGIGRTSVYRLGITGAELIDRVMLRRIGELRTELWPLMRRDVDLDEILVDGVTAAISWARDDHELNDLAAQVSTMRLHNLLVRSDGAMHGFVLSVCVDAFARARLRGQMRSGLTDDDAASWIQGVFALFWLRDDIDAEETKRLLRTFLVPALVADSLYTVVNMQAVRPGDFGARPIKRGELSRAEILWTALSIIDAHGVDALTIRALTEELGLSTMSVYRHFRTKDEILDGLGGLAWEVLDTEPRAADGWEEQVSDVFRRIHHKLREHPGLVAIMLTRPVLGLPVYRTVERLLGILNAAGFTVKQAFAAIFGLESYTLGFTVQQRVRDARRGADDYTHLADLPADEFPNLRSVVLDVPGWTTEQNFELGLATVIRGLRLTPVAPLKDSRGTP